MTQYLLRNILLIGSYYIVGKYSLLLAIPPGIAAPVWPAAGIALAGVLMWGRGVLPGIFVGAFAVNVTMTVEAGGSAFTALTVLTAAGVSFGAVAQAAFSSFLIRQVVPIPNVLEDEKDIFNLLIRGGLAGCLISATCGILVIYMAGFIPLSDFPFRWFIWWVGDAIGVVMATPLLLVIAAPGVTMVRKFTVSIPVMGIFVIATLIFNVSLQTERERTTEKFQNLASHQADLIRDRVILFQGILDSIKRFYGASVEVSSEEFDAFVRDSVHKYHGIQALKWIPRVPHSERTQFEQSVRGLGYSDFSIKEKAGSRVATASQSQEYFPVLYVKPLKNNEAALGYDLGSNPDSLRALKRARDTGKQITTANLTLVQGEGQLKGFLVFDPIYNNSAKTLDTVQARRLELKGFALGVFRIQELVDGVLEKKDRDFFNLYIFDTVQGNLQAPQYGAPSARSPFSYKIPLRIGENKWVMEFTPTTAFLGQQSNIQSWMFLIGGLLFASLLQIFLLSVTGRTDVVRRMVNEKNRELVDSEARHRAVVDNAADGLIVYDPEGLIESFNPASEKIFGYKANDILGKHINLLIPRNSVPNGGLLSAFDTTEGVGHHKDGSSFPIELSISLIQHEEKTLYSAIIRDIADRKAAEDRLQKLSKRVQLILDNAGDGVFGLDQNGNTTFANKAALDLLGYSLEEMLHVPQHALIQHRYPDGSDYPREESCIYASLQDGETRTEDSDVFWHRSGLPFPVEYTSSPIIDKDGIISGAVVVFKDISERKKAEEKIREAARFNDLIMNNVPGLVIVKDEQFRVVKANQAFFEFFPEEKRDHIIGATLIEDLAPETARRIVESDQLAFQNGSYEFEETFPLSDGQYRTFDTKKTCFKNSSGQKFILTFAQDVTEIRRKDQELIESEYAREAYAEAADDGYWDWSIQDDQEYMSPRFWEMLGYDPASKEHRPSEWHKIIFHEDLQILKESYKKHVETLGRHPFNHEVRFRHKDGSTKYIINRGKIVEWDRDGNPLRMIGTQTDITHIKNTEETLMKSNLELERFAYVASHDLQEPLRMISTFTELIKDEYGDVFDDTASRYMGFIYNAAKRMQDLVRDLLEYSRVDQDITNFDKVECSPLLSSVLEALSEVIEESQAEITFDELPVVHSNGIRISRLLQNLIGNGIKYRKADTLPKIHVGVEENEDVWIFSVSDNGIGIKSEYLEQIFVLFKRLHNKDEYSGTGIGLSICKKITESLGGKIWADSVVGEGTTFYFSIPKKETGKEAA